MLRGIDLRRVERAARRVGEPLRHAGFRGRRRRSAQKASSLSCERPLDEPDARQHRDQHRAADEHARGGRTRVRRSAKASGRKTATMASWPTFDAEVEAHQRQRQRVAAAGPGRPARWRSRSRGSGRSRRPPSSAARGTRGHTLFSAASTTEAAIADSTQREGSDTTPSVASDSVIECASVNAVTIFSTSRTLSRKRLGRLPAPSLPPRHQHRRQQQREQEQDVVEADPDVPHAFACVVDELRRSGSRLRKLEGLRRRLRAEHGGARDWPVASRSQQAAVLRVEVGEQRVVDRAAARGALAQRRCKRQHGVGAVGVVVDLLRAGASIAQGAPSAAHAPAAPARRRRCRRGCARTSPQVISPLPSASRPIAKSRSRSAMSHWPVTPVPPTRDAQVAVGRLVRLALAGSDEHASASARRAPGASSAGPSACAASACSTTLSTPVRRPSTRSTGAAASGWRAARAASSSDARVGRLALHGVVLARQRQRARAHRPATASAKRDFFLLVRAVAAQRVRRRSAPRGRVGQPVGARVAGRLRGDAPAAAAARRRARCPSAAPALRPARPRSSRKSAYAASR